MISTARPKHARALSLAERTRMHCTFNPTIPHCLYAIEATTRFIYISNTPTAASCRAVSSLPYTTRTRPSNTPDWRFDGLNRLALGRRQTERGGALVKLDEHTVDFEGFARGDRRAVLDDFFAPRLFILAVIDWIAEQHDVGQRGVFSLRHSHARGRGGTRSPDVKQEGQTAQKKSQQTKSMGRSCA